MNRSALLAVPSLTLAAALAHAGTFHPASQPKNAVEDHWMVLLPPSENADRTAQELMRGRGRVDHVWNHALRGFSAVMPWREAKALASHPRVLGVYQDVTLEDPFSAPLPDCSQGVALADPVPLPAIPESITCDDPNPQNPAGTCTDNWGLDRLDGTASARNGVYAPPRTGQGVHIFLVDTGLYAQHQEFAGRVGEGTDATGGGGTPDDCSSWSHGTHVAGIAAGSRFGVAKGATLHPARVAPCPLSIQLSSLVSAFDWIAQTHVNLGGPSVASMSINAPVPEFQDPSQPLGVAIAGVLAAGVLVIESAGNNVDDACGHVARVPGMLIVGGSDEFDAPWTRVPGDPNYAGWCGTDCGSNVGTCVDLFAPSAHIVSSWLGDPADARNTCRLSGTSMAAPHAAGTAALFLQANPAATPAQVKAALVAHAMDAINTTAPGTTHKLLSVLEGVPGISLEPAAGLAFGSLQVGTPSPAPTLTITSSGTLPLTVGTPSLTGPMASDFALSANNCSAALAPGAMCNLSVTFTPAAAGVRTASLVVPSNDPSRPQLTVDLSGEGMLPVVKVVLAGPGSGSVTSEPAAIQCGNTCTATFTPGTNLVLTAQAAPGSSFSGWGGIAGCSSGPCSFTVTASAQATATFFLLGNDAGSVDAASVPDAARTDAASVDAAGNAAMPDAGAPPGDEVGTASCGCHAAATAFPWTGLVALAWLRARRKTQLSGAPHTSHACKA